MVRALLAAAALLFVPGTAQAQIAALPGAATCLHQPSFQPRDEAPDCSPAAALTHVRAVAVSPDGRSAYAAVAGTYALRGGGVTTFARDSLTGGLMFASCVTNEAGDGRPGTEGVCADGDALRGVDDVAVSPDGRNVYATAPWAHGVLVFDRDDDGALTQSACFDDMPSRNRCVHTNRLGAPRGIAVTPDGRGVLVADTERGAVLWFDRNRETGTLAFAGCLSASGSDGLCTQAGGLVGAHRVVVAPDSRAVFVLADGAFDYGIGATVTSFVRDRDGGALEPAACLAAGAAASTRCAAPPTLAGARGLALSSDGRQLYIAAWSHDDEREYTAVTRLDVDGADLRFAGCTVPEATPVPGCESSRHLLEARSIASVGDLVVVAGGSRMTGFVRAPQTGALTDAWCATDADRVDGTSPSFADCASAPGAWHSDAVTISPDGRSVYAPRAYDGVVAILRAGPAVATRAAVRRAARLRVTCPSVRREGCSGTVALSGAAARRYAVPAGRSRVVAVSVPARLRAALRRHALARVAVALHEAGAAPIRAHVVLHPQP